MSDLTESQKKFYEEALQQTKAEIQDLEGLIQVELGKVKEKIAEGKLDKFFSERVMMEQQFVKDDKLTVTQAIQACVQQTGENIGIGRIVRFKVGER